MSMGPGLFRKQKPLCIAEFNGFLYRITIVPYADIGTRNHSYVQPVQLLDLRGSQVENGIFLPSPCTACDAVCLP